MGKRKLGCVLLLLAVVLAVSVLGSAASRVDMQNRWRKAMLSAGEMPMASSMMLSGVASSIVLPVHGNVYPIGFYNVTLNIGQPPRPYFLDVDTGSDLTWLQCDAPCVCCTPAPHPFYPPSTNFVASKDPLCAALHSGDYDCEDPNKCRYEVEYADGGSSLGILVKDEFLLDFTNGKRLSPLLALGCGYKQKPGGSYHPIDGVLGLGRGKPSILTQLSGQGLVRHVVGHCLSGRGGGFLFFGDDVYDASRVAWTTVSQEYSKYYSPGPAELTFDGKATELKDLLVAFDSGSSYSYLTAAAYQVLLLSVKNELSGKNLREAPEDHTLPICWKGKKPFKSIHDRDIKKSFKSWALSFTNGATAKSQFEFLPKDYLIISHKGNVCLGILNGTEVGLASLNLIGDVSMQDKMVIYDNEKQMIGWDPANCDRLPKYSSFIV